MLGLNTHPIAAWLPARCGVCLTATTNYSAPCPPLGRRRNDAVFFIEHTPQDVPLYEYGDAVSVRCREAAWRETSCEENTIFDMHATLFVDGGNVYARINPARRKQTQIFKGEVTLEDGSIVYVTRKIGSPTILTHLQHQKTTPKRQNYR